MKTTVLEKKGPEMTFVLDGADIALANSLRRIMISEVPTMAVHWIDVHHNNSALFDEVISHRMGLIPIKFDPKKFSFSEDCKCKGKGCPLCQVAFIIDKKGPCVVKSGDMKSSDKKVEPADPGVPIVELLEGQKIKLEAVARMGKGIDHSRHQAANATYQYYPEIKVTGGSVAVKAAVSKCPDGAVTAKGTKIEIKDLSKSDIIRSCLGEAEGVDVKGNENKLIFRVESISGLDPEDIVIKAADILMEKAEEFKKKLSKV